ncbi:histidinol-phosphatase HisJ family protein [Carboxydochorda subterranea]|uniref:Histidinol-phosphatase n=1 Tax=Carboxydichorda subterranea TaxID=3109565 RepID=A0ABZ1C1U4_9FIRM|nr:histidinol-phosphatase HisJ family protein [Limnochorda sp. L945t]WRP18253.1 histidinol-phosphatase HisJ family protein [Limnochorda sp. L945t]
MPGLGDYHMHLVSDETRAPLPYAPQRVERYVEAAFGAGVEEIGITEHSFRFAEFRASMAPLWEEGTGQDPQVRAWLEHEFEEPLERYVGAVRRAMERGLPVRLGIEVDYVPGAEEAIRQALEGVPWDYVMGSVHFVDGMCVDCDPAIGWPGADVDRVWLRYYELMGQAARSGLFDVLSHPDLPKKFGMRPVRFPEESFERFLQAARGAGTAVEINTAGLRKPAHEIYPARSLLSRMVAAGLDVHLGSDAHSPEQIGAGFEQAIAWAREAGVRRLVRWQSRKRRYQPL